MDETLKILLLEAFPEDAKLVESELEKGKIIAKTLVVDSKAAFIEALSEFSPDIILSDQSLPDFNSIDALKIIKSLSLSIPFILTTTTVTVEFAVQILREGADDCILKSDLTRLPAAIVEIIKKRSAQNAEKKARQGVDDTSERLLFHLENSPLGYIEWEGYDLSVKTMSKHAEEIFGFTEKEFKDAGRTGYIQVYEEDLPYAKKIIQQLLGGKVKNNTAQHRNYKKDGSVIWCEWFNSALKDKNGNVITIMSLVQDITERKRSEVETLRLVENLQKKNRELRQFAYMVSHNLRSPITKIQGLSMLFRNNPETQINNNSLLDTINIEISNLDNIVKDMNTVITASESWSFVKEYIPFDLKINQIKQVLATEIVESNAVITTDFSEVKGINSVKSYLYSILYNLICNAIKYRKQDEPLEIHIGSSIADTFICISVSDNGSGINLAKNGDKLFGLYKRFHGSEISGRGIGLSLVKTQTESLDGRIEVESIVNSGTTFKIYLPKE